MAATKTTAGVGFDLGGRFALPNKELKSTMVSTGYTTNQITPIEKVGEYFVKRDDYWDECGIAKGGKARTAGIVCRYAKSHGYDGIAVAVSRNSSVPDMLSRVCAYNGMRLHVHCPSGELPVMFEKAASHGAVVHQHRPGYMSVLRSRLKTHTDEDKKLLPLGLGLGLPECDAVEATAAQAVNLEGASRVVMVVGSGWMFRGVALGLSRLKNPPKLIGVVVGKPPVLEVPEFAQLVPSPHDFMEDVGADLEGIPLDPTYEAKCRQFVQPGDTLWIVCHRDTE